MLASSREPRAAANTPCRGRFHIGPACRAAYPCGRAVALPLQTGANIAAARFARNTKFARRGGIYPARGTLRCRKPGGYGIRPYGAPRGLDFPGWPPCFPGSVGRAFTPAAPLTIQNREHSRRRGARRDEGIPPYGRPGGRGNPIWPVVPGRYVGEGHAPPANPAPPRTGRIGTPPRAQAALHPNPNPWTLQGGAAKQLPPRLA